MVTKQPVSERELIQLQIQAYEFYAGLLNRAVNAGAHSVVMPKWSATTADDYLRLADELRARLAELEATAPAELALPATDPMATDQDPPAPESTQDVLGNTTAEG